VSLTISPCHFRVAEISFFALDYKFTTKLISHGKLFDVPRFHHITSDGPVFWQKAPLKKMSPNKLESCNLSSGKGGDDNKLPEIDHGCFGKLPVRVNQC
jgi:hypothetical protein